MPLFATRITTDFVCCPILEMVSHLLGLLGLVLVKVKLLDVTRQLCGRHVGTAHDG